MRNYFYNLNNIKTISELRELKAQGKLPDDFIVPYTKEEIELLKSDYEDPDQWIKDQGIYYKGGI